MIISASYKTDIPTFYGRWFLRRLEAGYCRMLNPYNRHTYRVSLERKDVDAFVFWTKNVAPFWEALDQVHRLGFPFVVQYTINGYPRELESSVVNADRSIEFFRRIAAKYDSRVAVWRYDTIVFSSLTSPEFHRQNFTRICRSLAGSTDEVVVSFAQIYRKTKINMESAADRGSFTWYDPSDEAKLELVSELAGIAYAHDMCLSMCSQNQYLVAGVEPARCVDIRRLSDVAGYRIHAPLKGNRPDCGCYLSRDIGEYDTCPHGCVYCYAVRNRELAQKRFREHDPEDDFLFRIYPGEIDESQSDPEPDSTSGQLRLF